MIQPVLHTRRVVRQPGYLVRYIQIYEMANLAPILAATRRRFGWTVRIKSTCLASAIVSPAKQLAGVVGEPFPMR